MSGCVNIALRDILAGSAAGGYGCQPLKAGGAAQPGGCSACFVPVGPGLDLILFIVQLGATGPPRYTLVLQIYNYITNFQLMCFCYMLFVGKMMPVLLSIRCFNDGDWVYRSLVAE